MLVFTRRMTEWINGTMKGIKRELPDMSDDDLLPTDLVIADDEEIRVDTATITESKRKLMNTLSFSYPGGSLANALSQIKQDEDPLSQSCFSQIRLERGRDDFEDDELTNLDWLQDTNLLKSISGNTRLCPSPLSSDGNVSDFNSESGKENDSLSGSYNMSPMPHPTHIPYNPHKHIHSKPPYSFSCLIFMAIEDSEEKKLPVKDIYSWILTHFPYFQHAPTGWKNSVRHNLSLNKCFQKVDKDKSSVSCNVGKGSYWCIDSDFRPNLLQALRKTPYHPYHQLQMMSSPLSSYTTPNKSPFNSPFTSTNTLSPHLFPLLSKRLNSASRTTLETDIDVANALVSLKKSGHGSRRRRPRPLKGFGSRSRSPSPPEFGSTADKERTTRRSRRNMSPIIVTRIPSCDHTYSASSVPKALLNLETASDSSIDGEYEFNELTSGDEFDSAEEEHIVMEVDFRFNNKKGNRAPVPADVLVVEPAVPPVVPPVVDKAKEIEGVNALLDLASIATSVRSGVAPKRNDSPARNTRSTRKS